MNKPEDSHLVLVQEMQAFDDVKSNRGALVVPMQLSRCLSQCLPQVSTLHPYTCLCKQQMEKVMLGSGQACQELY